MPTWTPTPRLVALAVCLVAGGCGPTVDGRPAATTPIGLASNSSSADDSSSVFDCDRIEVPTELGFIPDFFWYYRPFTDEEFGDEVLWDTFNVEIYNDEVGSYDLGEGMNRSYATCEVCVLINVDNGSTYYFQESGKVEIDAGSSPTKGKLESDLVDVRLVEVEIDPESLATTTVEGGKCIEIVDVEITSLVVEGWTCATGSYGASDGCNCGCGVPDPDCVSDRRNACDVCGDQGSCSSGSDCPGAIHPDDNALCDVATAWDCDIALYDAGDGVCNCGCGLVDPDCNGNALASACDSCTDAESCVAAGTMQCVGAINGVNNAECSPVPGWTCNPSFYAANDGCDCGCGIKDPDCAGGEASECEFCNEPGSCAADAMGCGRIDEKNTGQCN